jgi:exopolyphosphatase/guanosine-5'-triphosphate,3'-diphosphate pyrophosphatase
MRLRYDQAHAEHVKTLALQLFDAAEQLHGRGEDARELLEYAAVLHDVGYAISRRNHHKHALYIIQEADLPGFTPDEKAVVANVARYHRAGTPKPTHAEFQRLDAGDRRLVLELASFLRLANGLDRSHFRNVARLDARLEEGEDGPAFALTLRTHADPALDVWAARQGGELFEGVFGVPVEIRVAG